jgi:predicted aldo/keto reductase-like oxidoreductase
MYAVDYEDHALAKSDYQGLGLGAGPCLGCAHEACRSACPNGIEIPNLMRDAAQRLD